MTGFFGNPHVFFDTAVDTLGASLYVLHHGGPERIIFGSNVSGTRMPLLQRPLCGTGEDMPARPR